MSIRVKLFGPFAEPFPEKEITLSDPTTTTQLEESLKAMHPVFREHAYRIAVNRRMVDQDTPIKSTDELALLPPFSGG